MNIDLDKAEINIRQDTKFVSYLTLNSHAFKLYF